MMKKPSGNYESPLIELLQLEANDVVTASGDNYYGWDWDSDNPYDDGVFY